MPCPAVNAAGYAPSTYGKSEAIRANAFKTKAFFEKSSDLRCVAAMC
ncbi:hypothetical protein FHS78_003028 [Parvibaculum indicum]|nr:hypothetical protein [Parvibaculum indicum]